MSNGLTRSFVELEPYEYLPDEITSIDVPLQELNLLIAVVTCAACLYLVAVLLSWWFRLRTLKTHLRPFIFGVWLAKLSILLWSATGVIQIVVYDMTQPLITLPSRIGVMIAFCIMVWVTTRYYQSTSPTKSLFEDKKEDDPKEMRKC